MLTTTRFQLAVFLLTAFIVVFSHEGAQARSPNVVIIITDDQGWGDLSLHGNSNLRTPNIDALAKGGARFDRFYVSPVCAPTRASLLTGRYHTRTGVQGVTRGQERLNLDEVTFAELFKHAGYATAAFGKWHNGSQYPYHPNGRGFDEFYGFTCGHWANYFDTLLDHNGKEVQGRGYVTDEFTDHALKFIDAHHDDPFLCYVAYNTPHSPFQVPDRFFDRVKEQGLTLFNRDREKEHDLETISALAMCENIDENVGRLLAKLEEHKIAEDTIVMYMSDNGPNTWRWNDGMKGKKGWVDEGGVRSPFFVRWPGQVPAGKEVDRIAAHIDVLPTLVELTAIDINAAPRKPKPLDGVSLKPLLMGTGAEWPDRMLFSSYRNRASVRTQRYRADAKTLFDMQSDPGQRNNLAGEKKELHDQLAGALKKWQAEGPELLEGRGPDDRPYPVGGRPTPPTVLPAQDCRFQGKALHYSAPPPNASWMEGWANMADFPYWDIEVLTPGRYEATVKYTCGEDAVGTKLQLSFQGKSVVSSISEAYDPPLIESPDRVERKESYEKPFKRVSLGEIDLVRGRGPLELKALNQPGAEIIDLRAVELRLIRPE